MKDLFLVEMLTLVFLGFGLGLLASGLDDKFNTPLCADVEILKPNEVKLCKVVGDPLGEE